MYLPYEMLRNLSSREITADEQRKADEQQGQIAAAVARRGHRVAAKVHAVAVLAARDGHQRAAFRKVGSARRQELNKIF
jgi:hypothetical protein